MECDGPQNKPVEKQGATSGSFTWLQQAQNRLFSKSHLKIGFIVCVCVCVREREEGRREGER